MIVHAEKLSKTNGVKKILDEVSFSIEENDKIGVVGLNGIGKSTLLKIVAKLEPADDGDLIYRRDLSINYLPQIPDFVGNQSVWQIARSALDEKDVEDYLVMTMLNKFGLEDMDQKATELSGGQKKRLALAVVLTKPCDLLILDEPTNHLDNAMIETLEKLLMKRKNALLMVTHDRYFLERVTHKIMEINRAKIYLYDANYDLFLEKKAQREANDLLKEEKRKAFLRKEIEWVRAGVQARSTKSKERLERFNRLNAIEDIQSNKSVEMLSHSTRMGKKTIELQNVSHTYSQALFEPFSYIFKRNDRIAIIGNNGVGKSTLLNIIARQIKPTSGEVIYGDTIKTAFFKQGVEDMDESLRVIDYIKEKSDDYKQGDLQLTARHLAERFLFSGDAQYTPIARLSGGEKRRLYLLRVLMEKPNVLLLDEPTNDLDLETLAVFEDYLDDFNGIVITVSHDRFFIDRVCDSVFLFKNRRIEIHNGAYSDNLSLMKEDFIQTAKENTKVKASEKKKLSYKESHELEELNRNIPLLEEEIASLNRRLNEETDYKKIEEISNLLNRKNDNLEQANERWLTLMEIQES